MTIGLAMVTRNSASILPKVLKPFAPVVDQMAVVIGGECDDDTVEVAESLGVTVGYAEDLISPAFLAGASELLDDPAIPETYGHLVGYLADFSQARQLSFDLLETDWAVVVDSDDTWTGVDAIPNILKDDLSMIQVEYKALGSVMYQPRIFRRQAGEWTHTVHEQFKLTNGGDFASTADCRVRQSGSSGPNRLDQNILLGEIALAKNPADSRAAVHLAKAMLIRGDYDRALSLIAQYMEHWDREIDQGYLGALHLQGIAHLHLAEYESAAITALRSIGAQSSGAAWSILAEACLRMAKDTHGLREMAIMASDKAIASGKPRQAYGVGLDLSTTFPAMIKAMALAEMGRTEEALSAVDLGLAINPNHAELNRLLNQLCLMLDKAP